MSKKPPWQEKEILRELCKEQGLNDREIAEKLGCSQPTITRWRNRLNIEQPQNSPWRDEELLRELYKERGMSDREIAEKLGCTHGCIGKWREKFGIETDHYVDDILDDDEELRRLYEVERLSTYDIAEDFDCCEYSVRKRLIEFGIERRSRSDYGNNLLSDHDELRQLYVEDGLTAEEIAKRAGSTPSGVLYWMRKHGIAAKGPEDYLKAFSNSDLEKIESLYWEDEYSGSEIGEKFDVSPTTVFRAMSDAGIERRDVKEALRLKAGFFRESEPQKNNYGPNWRNIREEIIESAGHCCEICGKTRKKHYDDHGFDLHVHHVEKLRKHESFKEANDPENLICLCISCHNKWEGIPLAPITDSGTEADNAV